MIHQLAPTTDGYEFNFPDGPPTLSALDARRMMARRLARGRIPRGQLVLRARRGGGVTPMIAVTSPLGGLGALGKRRKRGGGGFAPWEWHKKLSLHHVLFGGGKKRRKKKRPPPPPEQEQILETSPAAQALFPTPVQALPAPPPPTSMVPGAFQPSAPQPSYPAAEMWAPSPEASMAFESPSSEDYLPEDEGARGAIIPTSEEFAYPVVTTFTPGGEQVIMREFRELEAPGGEILEPDTYTEEMPEEMAAEAGAAEEADGMNHLHGLRYWYQPTPPGLAPGYVGAEEQWFTKAARVFAASAPAIIREISPGYIRTAPAIAMPGPAPSTAAVYSYTPPRAAGGIPGWVWPVLLGVGALGVLYVVWPSGGRRRRRVH